MIINKLIMKHVYLIIILKNKYYSCEIFIKMDLYASYYFI